VDPGPDYAWSCCKASEVVGGAIGSRIPFAMRNFVASIHGQRPDTHQWQMPVARPLRYGQLRLQDCARLGSITVPVTPAARVGEWPPPCARLPGRGLQMPAGLMSRGPGPRLQSRWPSRIAAPGSRCGNGRSGAPRRRSRPGLPSRSGLGPGGKPNLGSLRLPMPVC
jgi:hypothetical protein